MGYLDSIYDRLGRLQTARDQHFERHPVLHLLPIN
jgi:hypothetical protein